MAANENAPICSKCDDVLDLSDRITKLYHKWKVYICRECLGADHYCRSCHGRKITDDMRTRTSNGISVLDHICRDCYTEDEKRRQKENKAKKAAAQITAPAPITPTPAAPPVTPTNAVTAQITSLTTNIGDFRTLTLTPAERERRRAEIYKAVDALLSTYNDPHEYAIPHLTPNYELMISAALRQIYVSEHIGANFQDMPVDVTYVGGTGYVRSVVAFSPEMAKHLAALQDGMMHYYRNR